MKIKWPIRGGARYLWKKGSKRGVEREELCRRENCDRGREDSSEVPEGTQLVTNFLWSLILNISGHLEIKILLSPTNVYLKFELICIKYI